MPNLCTRVVQYPNNEAEMRRILSSFLHEDVDAPDLVFTARCLAKQLREYGEVILLLHDNDPLVFRLAKPGSAVWRRMRTKEERDSFYAKINRRKRNGKTVQR